MTRLPIGAIGDTPTQAPRYVPGHRVTPLNTAPLSEADTWPSVPRYVPPYLVDMRRGTYEPVPWPTVAAHTFGQPAPRRIYLTPAPWPVALQPVRSSSGLPRIPGPPRWRPSLWRQLGWLLADVWDDARSHWLGQLAFLCVVTALGAGVVVGGLLVAFAVMGR